MVLDALILFKATMLEHAVVEPRHRIRILKVSVKSFLITNAVLTNIVFSNTDCSLPCVTWC